jgi:hypothetical protein
MSYSKVILVLTAAWIGAGCLSLPAQIPCVPGSRCFSVHVSLNGQRLTDPQTLTLIGSGEEKVISINAGEFHVSSAEYQSGSLALRFIVGNNVLFIPGVRPEWLNYGWDIELEDKQFPNGRGILGGHQAKRSCFLVIHAGEPEMSASVSNCRSPLKK